MSMEKQMLEHQLDHSLDHYPVSPHFTDGGVFTIDGSGLEYPTDSPFVHPAYEILPEHSPVMDFGAANFMLPDFSSGHSAGSPARSFSPVEPEGGVSPPALYSGSASNGEVSDGFPAGRHRRGTESASSIHSVPIAAVPRSQRFTPLLGAQPTRSAPKSRKRAKSEDSDDEDDDVFVPSVPANLTGDTRREAIRRQRIESEQRRRDELRDGYRKLKEVLPHSNQKSSKVSLLDRATTCISSLRVENHSLKSELKVAHDEMDRLRRVNEALMLSAAESRHPGSTAGLAHQQPR